MTARPLPSPPVAALLGRVVESVDVERGTLQVRFAARPEFANPAGQVQGGMLAAMLDDAVALLVDAGLPEGDTVATVSLAIAFHAPAMVAEVSGRSEITSAGRSIRHVQAVLSQAGRTVATAQAVCAIRRARS